MLPLTVTLPEPRAALVLGVVPFFASVAVASALLPAAMPPDRASASDTGVAVASALTRRLPPCDTTPSMRAWVEPLASAVATALPDPTRPPLSPSDVALGAE